MLTWRLYHKDSAHKLDRFYEVDLPAAVNADDPAAFLYFYAFFARPAFDPGPLSLSAILAASADYARGVEGTLKRQVYDALRHLAQGFLDYPLNALAPDEATLREIYESSLRLLYRLLFLLYAEARARYALHQRVRRRIGADLGGPGQRLNQKLTAWWGLDFPAFRAEVQRALRRDIPLRERDDWDAWLAEGRAAHARHTREIVRLESELNRRVYTLFDLTAAEVRMVEEGTKYRYGEV